MFNPFGSSVCMVVTRVGTSYIIGGSRTGAQFTKGLGVKGEIFLPVIAAVRALIVGSDVGSSNGVVGSAVAGSNGLFITEALADTVIFTSSFVLTVVVAVGVVAIT